MDFWNPVRDSWDNQICPLRFRHFQQPVWKTAKGKQKKNSWTIFEQKLLLVDTTEVMLESLTLASVNEVILWLGENPCKAEKKKKNTKWNTSRNTSRNMMCFSSSFQLYKDFILITTKPHHWGHARESYLSLSKWGDLVIRGKSLKSWKEKEKHIVSTAPDCT